MQRRLLIAAGLIALLFLTVSAKLVDVQIIEHPRWLARAEALQHDVVQSERRGRIYDRHGLLLATDVPAVSIALDSFHMTKPEVLKQILQQQLGLSPTTLDGLIYRRSYFTWIARQLDWQRAQTLKRAADQAGVQGLIYIDGWKRVYPKGSLASNVIGFVGLDGQGLEGIERSFDKELHGEEQQLEITSGARGIQIERRVLQRGNPGLDLTLTLDARIQFIAEQAIQEGVRKYQANAGMALVLDPKTGEILAMAQDQTYDLNDYEHSSALERKNLAVAVPFEPGSAFKPFVTLATLEAGAIRLDEKFDGDDGSVSIAHHVFHNADHRNYGSVTLADILTNSINTGMIQVAQRLGPDRLAAFLQRLGFAHTTGISLPGEVPGLLRPVDQWSSLDIGAVAIGQSVSVTGIQLISRFAALANGGLLRPPWIVSQLRDASGRAAPLPVKPDLPVQIASPANVALLTAMMEQVVAKGTGILAQIPGYAIAAKSGTAQKAVPGVGYVQGKYTSLFAGFFPADDPEYVILVVLDEPHSKYYYGGDTAALIFKQIAERIIVLTHLQPSGPITNH